MKAPRILLSGQNNLQYYTAAVENTGGIADAKYLPEIDTSYDGLILCGGCDIEPKRYGEEIDGAVNIDTARDEVEFALIKAYTQKGKPVMGICRGYQLINVFFGGSLYQNLPEAELHTNRSDFYCAHSVTAVKGSIVDKYYGQSFWVNSSHHQAIKKLGEGLKATAFWQDKYIEAVEHTALPVFGVQFHPERMCYGQRREDTVDGARLFEHFLNMCSK